MRLGGIEGFVRHGIQFGEGSSVAGHACDADGHRDGCLQRIILFSAGNRLQQLKPQLDALQQSIANQLASEKANASTRLDELEQRLQAAAEYQQLQPSQQAQLAQPFADARAGLGAQQRIAMIRDALRRFEDERFAALLLQLEQLSRPAPAPATAAPAGIAPPADEPAPTVARVVPARSIRVAFARPWLASEADLDDYLAQQRAAWLQEIRAGNRVQI